MTTVTNTTIDTDFYANSDTDATNATDTIAYVNDYADVNADIIKNVLLGKEATSEWETIDSSCDINEFAYKLFTLLPGTKVLSYYDTREMCDMTWSNSKNGRRKKVPVYLYTVYVLFSFDSSKYIGTFSYEDWYNPFIPETVMGVYGLKCLDKEFMSECSPISQEEFMARSELMTNEEVTKFVSFCKAL